MWSFEKLTQWIDTSLHGCMSDGWALLVEFVLIGVAVLVAYALIALFLIYAERKICGFFQCRLGPNRVGKWGIFQSVADMIKILLKELVHIDKSDKVLFRMASFFVIIGSICTFGALPFAKGLQAIDFNVGVFYLLAVSSLGVVGILLAGWSSNSKYSMIGAMRSGAQLISYEISAGLSLMVIVVFSGTMQLSEIVAQQADGWFIFKGHVPACIAFLTYLIAGHAETNRGPFDMPEAESELTAGYHTEYSSMKLGFYLFSEYINMFISSAVMATLFFGGYDIPFVNEASLSPNLAAVLSVVSLFIKILCFIFLFMWVRWTIPRFRYDQLMRLGWRILIPLALFNMLVTGAVILFLNK